MIGQVISHYRIIEKLGEGGMGVVYRAQDTTLDRPVALKFLPPSIAASEQDKARFIQEAKSAAALNHPNICTVYGIEEHDGQTFIAMELVDGQTLRETKQSFSVKQTIDIGIQIADGLAAAHEKGIVHRDIKPENIMIRKDGIVQIMDFGLAKLRGASRLTKEGTMVGTVGYMSPEQVQGQELDHRSDIFSLGVILYEMFSGQSPFKGVHETAIIYEIVNVDATPISSLKPDIDPELDAIVLECLAKEKTERYQSVAEVAKELRRFKRESGRSRVSRMSTVRPLSDARIQEAPPPSANSAHPQRAIGRWIPYVIAGFSVLAVGAYEFMFRSVTHTEAIWASINLPHGMSYVSAVGGHSAISPDGSMAVFSAVDSSYQRQLWIRPLRSATLRPLTGTKDAEYPFWSYDSKSIGFFSEGKLKITSATGGPVLSLADAPLGRGGAWGSKGVIVYSPNVAEANLYSVPAGGGAVRKITDFDSAFGRVPRFPSFMPDGNHFLFTSVELTGRSTNTVTYLGTLDGGPPKEIGKGMSNCILASGYLLFLRQGVLMAQPFNESALKLEGDGAVIEERVNAWAPRAKGDFSASENGILLSSVGEGALQEEAVWNDSEGRLQPLISATPWSDIRLSPDETRLVFDEIQGQDQRSDLWVYDLTRGVRTRLTLGTRSGNNKPIWSRDGSMIVYSSEEAGSKANLFEKRADGAGPEVALARGPNPAAVLSPLDVSPDGRTLLFSEILGNRGELCTIDLSNPNRPLAINRLEIAANDARYSPDGKWIVCESFETGTPEIFVRATTKDGSRWQISSGGGQEPHWFGNQIVFYSTAGDAFVTVDVTSKAGTLSFGQARPLFPNSTTRYRMLIARSKDGRRYMALRRNASSSTSALSIVINWPRLIGK